MNESIYYNIDAIQSGISQNKKIQFKYFEYTVQKRESYRSGMNGHLAKPINVRGLMKELANLLG